MKPYTGTLCVLTGTEMSLNNNKMFVCSYSMQWSEFRILPDFNKLVIIEVIIRHSSINRTDLVLCRLYNVLPDCDDANVCVYHLIVYMILYVWFCLNFFCMIIIYDIRWYTKVYEGIRWYIPYADGVYQPPLPERWYQVT